MIPLKIVFECDFCVISAYQADLTEDANIDRQKKLYQLLTQHQLKSEELIGYWYKCQDVVKDHRDCPREKLIKIVEKCYFVRKPKNLVYNKFKSLMEEFMTIDNITQDAIVLNVASSENNADIPVGLYLYFKDGILEEQKDITSIKYLAQVYSTLCYCKGER